MNIKTLRNLTPEELNTLNPYSLNYLQALKESGGLNSELWEEAIDDMLTASELGVDTDEEYKIFFYIDHFAEDIAEEIVGMPLSEQEQKDLKKFMFSNREDIKLDNLVGFRVSFLMWQKSRNGSKTAGMHSRTSPPSMKILGVYDMERWAMLVNNIHLMKSRGISDKAAVLEASKTIENNVERMDFVTWYNFRFGKMQNLYNLNKNKRGNANMKNDKISKFAGVYEDAISYYVPKEIFKNQESDTPQPLNSQERNVDDMLKKHQDESVFQKAKSSMISRTFALDKLLEKYRDTMDEKQIQEVEEAVHSLRALLRKIKKASIAKDIMFKTAAYMEKQGFQEGSQALRKIASQALSKTAEDADIVTTLSPKSGIEELGALDQLISKLTDVSTFLKQRSIVRDIAQADLMLYDLNIASLFPELTEAQSRLIEAFTYASNRIDDILPKIRGSAENLRIQESDSTKQKPAVSIPEGEIEAELPSKETLEFVEPESLPEVVPLATSVKAPPKEISKTTPPLSTKEVLVEKEPPAPREVQELKKAIEEG